jgi:uracil DNA glycosylase
LKLSSHYRHVDAPRRWTVLLLALLFLVTASEQAVHTHRGMLPASKQVTDILDSNSAARCHICLHSQAAPLGSVAVSVSPHVAAEAAVPPSPLEAHAPGEEWVHHVRPPPVA